MGGKVNSVKTESASPKGLPRTELFALILFAAAAAALYARAFFGTELTDEAFYMADALGMLHGNLPYALDNFFFASGFTFLEIPLFFIYERLVPGCAGIVLFSRLCFVSFHLLCLLGIVRALKRCVGRTHVLLYAACFLPCIPAGLVNFSYNSIPLVLSCLVGALVWNAVEAKGSRPLGTLLFAGFLSGIAVFANPAYACAVLLNLALIPLRSEKGRKLPYLACYIAGGIAEILFVLIPLLFQAGWKALWDGFAPLFTNVFVQEPMSDKSALDKILLIGYTGVQITALAVSCLLALFVFRKTKKKNSMTPAERREFFLLWIAASICLLAAAYLFKRAGYDNICDLGLAGAACMVLLILAGEHKRFSPLLYLGVYPILFALMEVFLVSSKDSVGRFDACLPVLFCALLLLMERGGRPVRRFAVAAAAALILLQFSALYSEPYREEPISKLTVRVESGVYKGLYTTPARAGDLPRTETLLNALVGEEEYFAFRDNAPCCYLMLHQGKMCDICPWDVLQHSYGHNTPAKLFDYYRRRGSIPDVIIYVDIGRDESLSIDDAGFRYNDFVRAYYRQSEEYPGNETFRRIVVYRYAGGFDGDYSSWIEGYNTLPSAGGAVRPAA